MHRDRLEKIFYQVKAGTLDVGEAVEQLRHLPYDDLDFAKPDLHRDIRKGFPEVIFCPGKTNEQIRLIAGRLFEKNDSVMATRATEEVFDVMNSAYKDVTYFPQARIVLIGKKRKQLNQGTILVVSAGTSDIPVAEEAAVTSEIMGNKVERLFDVGVAGIHRLFSNKEKLFSANVIIVVAGMEGALASIVGGMAGSPVIAVPTSVGYGSNFDGLAALLSMLNCCAPGVTVVNIDNGFGAGYSANLINRNGDIK